MDAELLSKLIVIQVGKKLPAFYVTQGAAVAQSGLTTDWTTGFRSPTEAENFSSSPCVQTGSGAHLTSCTMGTGGPFPEGKARPGRDADHSPPSSAEVKNELELYLLSPQAPLWCVAGQLLCTSEGSSPCSQEPATGPYLDLGESSLRRHTLFL
jgi:hypothetical protein